ncbi:MAG: biopolymer transporter ExbD [Deltaproteobacteria bacterium]|nr:biopolymer transporter ExbD [Deltaproteobacteria bacterium]MBI3294872.1 biopolymer transporter ExbD [Deltaproteobacteria bacterium]
MAFTPSSDDLSPLSEINVTPLIDVMLVLLVVFMVAAPMLESGIAIQLPKATAKALPKNEQPTTLSMTKDYRIFINKTEVPYAELISHLQSFFRGRPNPEIFIRADGDLPYAFVAQAMSAVKTAGIHKIGLVTLSEEKKKKK